MRRAPRNRADIKALHEQDVRYANKVRTAPKVAASGRFGALIC
jgi:hypothetical protein